MIRLSIIVPVYGVEKYIEECIRSLYAQNIPQEEYEVICVDDCSPDNSVAVIEEWKLKVENLKLIRHTENKRQGGARNTGLREARGRYVWFVDGDDTIRPNCVGAMLKKAEDEQLDLLKFYFAFSKAQQQPIYPSSTEVTNGSKLIFDIQSTIPLLSRCNSAVQQLIRKDFLIEQSISFAEKLQYEDDDYAYQLYAYAERVSLMGIAPYIVRQTPNSTTRRQNDSRRIRDIYAQALRMEKLDAELSRKDERWHEMITKCIDDCINNCVFRMLKGVSVLEQLHFWFRDRKQFWKLKPYLSRKSFIKLSSYFAWKLLQK